ncbi:ABC transporter ATP-binding protein [Paenibacillus jilunlii]|uniref:ABC-2 type transport system ATP-binding protein n=1 Tax=Paenibacillus jilunlii TaxID=682956 RepID=A0A1G9S9W1_9BACL|nr:ABC transporter ATP-binding protein [Paenibacillus jilunlii]SDM32259.1 ABC-2 type transport system ATP-binding protein [Paenibacillus jilunlii]
MKPEIIIDHLSKNFGKREALRNVSLHIQPGMFGLLGRNGAGKTTLMRVLATLLHKSGGSVTVCGIPIEQSKEVRKLIGYLPQDFSIYPGMTVYAAMNYLGILSELPKAARKERITALLKRVNLEDCLNLKVKALSGGMKRRLGIAQAILHDPQILIVDEPTAGLDPEERIRFRDLLCEIAENRIVILSTHIVEDIEKTCQNIAVLDKGQIIYQGALQHFIGNERGLEEAYMKQMGGHQR